MIKARSKDLREPLKADMAKVGETMLKEWVDRAGADGKALLDAYRR